MERFQIQLAHQKIGNPPAGISDPLAAALQTPCRFILDFEDRTGVIPARHIEIQSLNKMPAHQVRLRNWQVEQHGSINVLVIDLEVNFQEDVFDQRLEYDLSNGRELLNPRPPFVRRTESG